MATTRDRAKMTVLGPSGGTQRALIVRTEDAGTVFVCGGHGYVDRIGKRLVENRIAGDIELVPCCRDDPSAGLACHQDDADEEVVRCRLLLTVALARAEGHEDMFTRAAMALVDMPSDGAAGLLKEMCEMIGTGVDGSA